MSGILVVAEHDSGTFKPTAAELIGKAAALAAELGTTVSAAVLGDAPAAELGGYGAQTVYQAAGDFSSYDTGANTDALAAIIKASEPDFVIAPASFSGREVLPRLAARFSGEMASDCMNLTSSDGQIVGRRPMYAGRVEANVTVQSRPAFYGVRPKTFPATASSGASADVQQVEWASSIPTLNLVETLAPDTSGVDLGTADRVVAGGRSLKSEENFDSVIRPLASALGAGVGASRAATDAGYAPHNEQVGQTGQTVNPTLYIAAGISGAIQHLAGMRTSKVIVAINKDPDAPIFEHATYGIVADLFDVVPALTSELKG